MTLRHEYVDRSSLTLELLIAVLKNQQFIMDGLKLARSQTDRLLVEKAEKEASR